MDKTLNNTTANQAVDQVSDHETWGEENVFKLICKASSKKEGWMKSTKAMEIPGVGCVVQVTTQQVNDTGFYKPFDDKGVAISDFTAENEVHNSVIAEAVTFVPGVKIEETFNTEDDAEEKIVISRKLVAL